MYFSGFIKGKCWPTCRKCGEMSTFNSFQRQLGHLYRTLTLHKYLVYCFFFLLFLATTGRPYGFCKLKHVNKQPTVNATDERKPEQVTWQSYRPDVFVVQASPAVYAPGDGPSVPDRKVRTQHSSPRQEKTTPDLPPEAELIFRGDNPFLCFPLNAAPFRTISISSWVSFFKAPLSSAGIIRNLNFRLFPTVMNQSEKWDNASQA